MTPAASVLSRNEHTFSMTSRPCALFCWNLSAHFCSIFSAIDAKADKVAHVMLVSCLKTVHSGFSGCGLYQHFSSTSTKSFRVMFLVTISIVRVPAKFQSHIFSHDRFPNVPFLVRPRTNTSTRISKKTVRCRSTGWPDHHTNLVKRENSMQESNLRRQIWFFFGCESPEKTTIAANLPQSKP